MVPERCLQSAGGFALTVASTEIASHSSPKEERAAAFDYAVWDKVVRELHQQYPSYASITLSRSEAKISLPGRMRRSDTVRFDSRTGEIRKVIPYQDTPRAQQLKMWFYAFHTGTWGASPPRYFIFWQP